MRNLLRVAFAATLMSAAAPAVAVADTITVSSPGVWFSVSDGGFYVRTSEIARSNASSTISGSDFHLSASGQSYSDAGIVLYFDGGLTLGALRSVSVTGSGSPVINLWLDTSGDGGFFAFDSNGLMTGLAGDSYGSSGSSTLGAATGIEMLGGLGAGHNYTLAQLQAGALSGVNSGTRTALWIGITGQPTGATADIPRVDIDAVPEPGSLLLLCMGLALAAWRARASTGCGQRHSAIVPSDLDRSARLSVS